MPLPLAKQRARTAEDKLIRRTHILGSAHRLLERGDWTDLRIEDVARGAGVAKASVFRYFATKEELVLEVYLAELGAIFGKLGATLAVGRARDRGQVAAALARTLVAAPLFVRLSAAVHAVLARSVSVESARRFKVALHERLGAAGAALEERLALGPGDGLKLLLRFHAVVIGLFQMADLAPNVARALDAGGLDSFRIDFAREVEQMFVALTRDMEPKA